MSKLLAARPASGITLEMVSELREAVGQQSAGQIPATHHSAVPLKRGEVLHLFFLLRLGINSRINLGSAILTGKMPVLTIYELN
jgi:hypothetical protein